MRKRAAYLLVFFVAFALGVIVTDRAERKFRKIPKPKTIVQVDTLRDTVYIDSPIPFAVRVVDSIMVPVPGEKDTVWLQLPREQKVYGDTTYLAYVSGYDPALDSIRIYRQNIYTTITETIEVPAPRKKNYFELDARLMYDGAPLAPVTANLGYRRSLFDVYAGAGYDFIQRAPVAQVGLRTRIEW